jgi:hypothetical protein
MLFKSIELLVGYIFLNHCFFLSFLLFFLFLFFVFFCIHVVTLIVIQATLDKCNELLGMMDVEIGAATPTNSSVSVAIPMLSMRLFANSFKGSGSSSAIASHLDRYVT